MVHNKNMPVFRLVFLVERWRINITQNRLFIIHFFTPQKHDILTVNQRQTLHVPFHLQLFCSLCGLHPLFESWNGSICDVEKLPLCWKIFNLHEKSNPHTAARPKKKKNKHGRGLLINSALKAARDQSGSEGGRNFNPSARQEKGQSQDKVTG